MSSRSEAFFLMSFQMSMVKMVEAELKMEVREDIRAASITASIRPFTPGLKKDGLCCADAEAATTAIATTATTATAAAKVAAAGRDATTTTTAGATVANTNRNSSRLQKVSSFVKAFDLNDHFFLTRGQQLEHQENVGYVCAPSL